MSSASTAAALLSYQQAAAMVSACAERIALRQPPVLTVDLASAAGRVLAQEISADQDQPSFDRSTRDGFACRAADASTHEFLALAGTTRAGEALPGPLPHGAAWEIMTGAPVPVGADAVMMIEHVEAKAGRVRLLPDRKIAAGENVVAQGAQARKGDELLAAGTTVTFAQIALAASCGLSDLAVFARPRVAILTTGDELVPVDSEPGPGKIRNSNAPMLASMVAAAGGDAWVLPTAADRVEALDAVLAEAAAADMLLISGGVSAGKFDLVEPALARRGARFHFTGVRIQPGKPLVFGEMARTHDAHHGGENSTKCCFFGLPGNPVSSAVTFLLFAAPILSALAGTRNLGPRFALASLKADTDQPARSGLTRFLPASCNFSAAAGALPEVEPVPWQGSGDLAAMARSNCFLVIPEETASLPRGAIVRILLP